MKPLNSVILTLYLIFSAITELKSSEDGIEKYTFSQACMGTMFKVVVYSSYSYSDTATIIEQAYDLAEEMNNIFSDYMADSEVGKFNRCEPNEPHRASSHLIDLLKSSKKISLRTQGNFDPTCGSLSRLWRLSRRTNKLPSPKKLEAAKAACGFSNLKIENSSALITKLNPDTRLDFGGIAKGYTADKMLELLKNKGLSSSSISAGGDIVLGDPPPGKDGWRVQIIPYRNKNRKPTTIKISNAAVSTSGNTEQAITIKGQRYSHILNPISGLGLIHENAATVIAPSGTYSDPLATALCIMEKRAIKIINESSHTEAILFLKKDQITKQISSAEFTKFVE
ncbi:MAG: FAD:protein FMN transferase [Akkermansiaceae bacterium]|jgi:FAD:protein FMN transferase|nr:FAD:protein FMN transferase [Akkermansiaceae bacterium]MDG1854398.1 FAD:protein FMN transferase [Verrucomicrobiales bacterium]